MKLFKELKDKNDNNDSANRSSPSVSTNYEKNQMEIAELKNKTQIENSPDGFKVDMRWQ